MKLVFYLLMFLLYKLLKVELNDSKDGDLDEIDLLENQRKGDQAHTGVID